MFSGSASLVSVAVSSLGKGRFEPVDKPDLLGDTTFLSLSSLLLWTGRCCGCCPSLCCIFSCTPQAGWAASGPHASSSNEHSGSDCVSWRFLATWLRLHCPRIATRWLRVHTLCPSTNLGPSAPILRTLVALARCALMPWGHIGVCLARRVSDGSFLTRRTACYPDTLAAALAGFASPFPSTSRMRLLPFRSSSRNGLRCSPNSFLGRTLDIVWRTGQALAVRPGPSLSRRIRCLRFEQAGASGSWTLA